MNETRPIEVGPDRDATRTSTGSGASADPASIEPAAWEPGSVDASVQPASAPASAVAPAQARRERRESCVPAISVRMLMMETSVSGSEYPVSIGLLARARASRLY